MPPVAFALREEYAGTVDIEAHVDPQTDESIPAQTVPVFSGGLIAVGRTVFHEDGTVTAPNPDKGFDVRAELDKGNGVIVVDDRDHPLVQALDDYNIVLERVPAPAGDSGPTKAELVAQAEALGVRDIPTKATKADLEALIAEAHAAAEKAATDTNPEA